MSKFHDESKCFRRVTFFYLFSLSRTLLVLVYSLSSHRGTLRGNFEVKIFPSHTETTLVLSRATYLPSYLSAFPNVQPILRRYLDEGKDRERATYTRCMLSVCTESVPFSIYGDSMGSALYLRLPQGASITACDRDQRLSSFVTCQIGKHSYREPAWKVSFSSSQRRHSIFHPLQVSAYHPENSTDSTSDT